LSKHQALDAMIDVSRQHQVRFPEIHSKDGGDIVQILSVPLPFQVTGGGVKQSDLAGTELVSSLQFGERSGSNPPTKGDGAQGFLRGALVMDSAFPELSHGK